MLSPVLIIFRAKKNKSDFNFFILHGGFLYCCDCRKEMEAPTNKKVDKSSICIDEIVIEFMKQQKKEC